MFNLGHSLTETQELMRKRFHRQIPERTISSWLTEYRPLTTYSRMRTSGKKLYSLQRRPFGRENQCEASLHCET